VATSPELTAQAFLVARRARRYAADLPEADRPGDLEAAYVIQKHLLALTGKPAGGWKIAVGSSPTPVCSPVPADAYAESGAMLDIADSVDLVEAEIAVHLASDLPVRAEPYAEADIEAAIGSIHPALEFIGPGVDFPSDVANFQRNITVVVGPALSGWRDVENGTVAIDLVVGSDTHHVATGATRADTITALTWLANGRAKDFGGLKAGQVIITGSRVNTSVAGMRGQVEARFAGLGSVAATVS
jgi:2-keto-4-pentenoate hydratase